MFLLMDVPESGREFLKDIIADVIADYDDEYKAYAATMYLAVHLAEEIPPDEDLPAPALRTDEVPVPPDGAKMQFRFVYTNPVHGASVSQWCTPPRAEYRISVVFPLKAIEFRNIPA